MEWQKKYRGNGGGEKTGEVDKQPERGRRRRRRTGGCWVKPGVYRLFKMYCAVDLSVNVISCAWVTIECHAHINTHRLSKRRSHLSTRHLIAKSLLLSLLWFLLSHLSLCVKSPGAAEELFTSARNIHIRKTGKWQICGGCMPKHMTAHQRWRQTEKQGNSATLLFPADCPIVWENATQLRPEVFPALRTEKTGKQLPEREGSASNLDARFCLVLVQFLIGQSREGFLSLLENGQRREEKSCL